MKYTPYRDGYSVLPGLHKLDNLPIFEKDEHYDYYLAEKKNACANQQVFLEHDISAAIYLKICNYIRTQVPELTAPFTFESIALQLQEDLAIHRYAEEKDWLAACHVCFPSNWLPEEKIGRSLSMIHEPVPGMRLENSLKMVHSVIHHGPYYRFVWGPIFEKQINFHPSIKRRSFDPANPMVYVKVERQIIIGFPDEESFLFILRQHLIEPQELDYPALYKACKEMNEAQRKYKGVTKPLLDYLQTKAKNSPPNHVD